MIGTLKSKRERKRYIVFEIKPEPQDVLISKSDLIIADMTYGYRILGIISVTTFTRALYHGQV